MLRQREVALNAKKRSMQLHLDPERKSSPPVASDKVCHKCGQSGHLARYCRTPSTKITKVEEILHLKAKEMTTRKEFEDALPELTEKIGRCKLCNRSHTYERKLSL